MIYLAWNPGRNSVWTEHRSFPKKAIRLWREGNSGPSVYARHRSPFRVYEMNDDRTEIWLIPEEEWDAQAARES